MIATVGRRSIVVPFADIDWIEAQDYCVLVHTAGASHLLRESIRTLAERHRLILVTKGNAQEQQKKFDRSGIHMHFTAVEIPSEKHPDAYREIVERHALVPESTWMIGNSPRSDINPALAAGLHAVYVHHPNTWILEHDELAHPAPPQRLIRLDHFGALTEHF